MLEKAYEYFATIPDPRCACDVKHPLKNILMLVLCAVLCGQEELEDIVEYGEQKKDFLQEHFQIDAIPSKSTLSRVLALVDAEAVTKHVLCLLQESLGIHGKTLAVDGKTIRSTENFCSHLLHIITAYLTDSGVTLGQIATDEKSNEIPAVRDLLLLLQIEGYIVTADAMHCQKDTAALIHHKGAEYFLQVKNNQKGLFEDIELYVQDEIQNHPESLSMAQSTETAHGRKEQRTCYATGEIDWLEPKDDWLCLRQIVAVENRTEKKGQETVEWHYYITSADADANTLLSTARNHWKIESMHWALDTTFSEDTCRLQSTQAQKSMNAFRKFAIALHKQFIQSHSERKGYKKKSVGSHMLKCLFQDDLLVEVIEM